jgi:hypothetical protein
MPDKNNRPRATLNQSCRYRLARVGEKVFDIIEDDSLDRVTRKHIDSLAREIDRLVNRDRRDLIVFVERCASEIRCKVSHLKITSFEVIGEPIFDGDIDDTDSLDVTALRAQIARERREKE